MKVLSRASLILTLLLAGLAEVSSEQQLPIHDGVGGEFTAESSLGRKVSSAEFRGKVVLLFFGYTSCQDICPATLAHLQSLMKRIGTAAKNVQVLFVTVDPENDTAEHLKKYLVQFNPRFIGLTGTQEQINQIAKLFLVKHDRSHGVKVSTEYNRSKTFTEHSYLYAHSQQIYLLDKLGRTRALFFTGSPLSKMREAVLALLAESTSTDCDSSETTCPENPAVHRIPNHVEGDE
ncbi:MAG: SCO family protein [Myxococcota bacterium]